MHAKKKLIVACAVFNIVVGANGAFAGGVLVLLTAALGTPGEVVVAIALLVGSVLYAVAGTCLLLSDQQVLGISMALQSAAILLGMLWVVYCVFDLRRDQPLIEGVVMWVILPAVVVLIAIAELALLRRLQPRTDSQP